MFATNGTITVVSDSDSTNQTILVNSSSVFISSDLALKRFVGVTLNTPLVAGKVYHVEITPLSFRAVSDLYFQGYTNNRSWAFTTAGARDAFTQCSPYIWSHGGA